MQLLERKRVGLTALRRMRRSVQIAYAPHRQADGPHSFVLSCYAGWRRAF